MKFPRCNDKVCRGAIVPLVAIFLPVLLALAGFVVNLSYVELTRTQLRISTDAASRAAGYKLVATGSTDSAKTAAREAAQRNPVAGAPLQLDDQDIVFGVASRPNANARYTFTPGVSPPNSVQILGRRTNSSQSGNVSLVLPMGGSLGSFEVAQSATSTQVELDVVLVLDRSGSMAYGPNENSDELYNSGIMPASAPPGWAYCDAAPSDSRWRDLVGAVEVFINVLQLSTSSEKVGLATYGSDAKYEAELTANYSAISEAIDDYTQSLCLSATNVGSGIEAGTDVILNPNFSRQGAVKVMIVMTDGRHNTGPEPAAAAQAAADQNIFIYTVTFSAEAEQDRMIEVAEIGEGEHYHASTSTELEQAFEKIASSLPTLLTE